MAVDQLSGTFAALADPTRRAILVRLADGEATVNELAEPFAMSLPAISKHLKVLEHAGLITRGRTAQWRPCRLRAEPLGEAAGWIDRYRTFWQRGFDRLDAHLAGLQSGVEPPAASRRQRGETPKSGKQSDKQTGRRQAVKPRVPSRQQPSRQQPKRQQPKRQQPKRQQPKRQATRQQRKGHRDG